MPSGRTSLRLPHNRRSIRLRGYDYGRSGVYFVTICTHNRGPLLCHVGGGSVRLTATGRRVSECWEELPIHFPYLVLDEFVVMPDHVHGVLHIRDCRAGPPPAIARFGHPPPAALSSIVGAFKAAASKRINADRGIPGAPVWQRNYYECVIRSNAALERVRVYIARNPIRWGRTAVRSAR